MAATKTRKNTTDEEVYVATVDFHAEGYPNPIEAGRTLILESHELRQRYPANFRPARKATIEQATAAPGELRAR